MRIFDFFGRSRDRLEIVGDIAGGVRLIVASSPAAVVKARVERGVAATYIGLWRDDPAVYVGGTGSLPKRLRDHPWHNRGIPDAIVALCAVEGGGFEADDALALERIAAHAVGQRVPVASSLPLAYGSPRGSERYSELQAIWARALPLLEPLAPVIACPWPGPPDVIPIHETPIAPALLEVEACGLRAFAYQHGSGWAVRAGSFVRMSACVSAYRPVQVARDELVYAGMLRPEGPDKLLLTRDVARNTLGGCTTFVFTHRGPGGLWRKSARRHRM
ncbi:hypothetical protein ACTZWW_05030 [Salinarimonas sp. NSM]|uniref:hypothetical protein n=1 Tax=Salinarimonas sp. NSM TaxID=3458003 RepID=UPI004035B061